MSTTAELYDELWAFVRSVPSRSKHGPNGSGRSGPCDPDCLKCRAQELLKRAPGIHETLRADRLKYRPTDEHWVSLASRFS